MLSCGPYTLKRITTDAATFEVRSFENHADRSPGSTMEPQLDRDFTTALQDRIVNLTDLSLKAENGDLRYEGEIIAYRVSPTSATAQQTAAQNRLTMGVNVRFFDKSREGFTFEKQFSYFYDFPGDVLLESVKDQAHEVLFERITQDIINTTLATDW